MSGIVEFRGEIMAIIFIIAMFCTAFFLTKAICKRKLPNSDPVRVAITAGVCCVIVSVVLFLLSTCGARCAVWSSGYSHFDMIDDCEQSADYDLKVSGCDALIFSDRWTGERLSLAYAHRGYAYSMLKQYHRAVQDYDQAIKIDPSKSWSFRGRGRALTKLNEYRRGIHDIHQAIDLDPEDVDNYVALAWAQYENNANEQALASTERALLIDPENVPAIDIRALVLTEAGRTEEALADFERVMQIGGADWIDAYQSALQKHGLYDGKIDGVYDPEVRAALLACLAASCRLLPE